MSPVAAPSTPYAVLRSNDVCFLGILRSLAAAGAKSVPFTFTWEGAGPWYSEASRHVVDPVTMPNPFAEPLAARDAMVAAGKRLADKHGERLLAIPSSDTNLMFLLDHWEAFAPYYRIMGAADFLEARPDVVRKDRCAELLEAGGVAAPKTRRCASVDEIEPAVADMIYPCVYKPLAKDYGQSFYRAHGGNKAVTCNTPDELRTKLAEEVAQGFELVVQERVFFDSVYDEIPCYVYVDAEHRVRMLSTAIKEKIQPFPYGTATVLRFTSHPELFEQASRVAKAIRWRGVLMIEFIRDTRDGVWKVIEVNGRPWLFVDFFRRSGQNYLGALHADATGDTAAWPDVKYPDAQVLEESPVHVALPTAYEPGAGAVTPEAVAAYLDSIRGAKCLTYLDPGDREPGVRELAAMASKLGLSDDELLAAVTPSLSRY